MTRQIETWLSASQRRSVESGFGLIELMIAMLISLFMLGAVLVLFLDFLRTNDESANAGTLIESGQFSLQLLREDASHAGFWGELDNVVPEAFSLPDVCDAGAWAAADLDNLLGAPLQVINHYSAEQLAKCGITRSEVFGNPVVLHSDVLAVAHAAISQGVIGTDLHIQISGCRNSGSEPAYLIDKVGDALDASIFSLQTKACDGTKAPLRKIVSNVYYLADNERGVPTLWRSSWLDGEYVAEALVDGVEAFHVELGVDNRGRNGAPISASNPPDGSADEYVVCTEDVPCSREVLVNVVALKIYVLARSLELAKGYQDTKSYQLGDLVIAAKNDGYKRHAYSTTVRLVNPSGRREIP